MSVNYNVTVEKFYIDRNSTSERAVYQIGVTYAPADRKGNLTNVNVTDLLPKGFGYTRGNSTKMDGEIFEPTNKTSSSLTWTITRLEHDETLYINVAFSIENSADTKTRLLDNMVYASWKAEDGTIQESLKKKAAKR